MVDATNSEIAMSPSAPMMRPVPTYDARLDIAAAERVYRGKYIGDFAIKTRDGRWSERPAAVFYVPEPDVEKGHKHYVGLFLLGGNKVSICDATCVAEHAWNGVMGANGEVVISTYRHDYRETADGTAFVDGGQDYMRFGGTHVTRVSVRVDGAAWAAARQKAVRKPLLGFYPVAAHERELPPNNGLER